MTVRLFKKNYRIWYVLVTVFFVFLLCLPGALGVNRELQVFYGDQWQIGYAPLRRISWTVHGSPNYAGDTYWDIKQYARNQWASAGFTSTLNQPSSSTIHIIFGSDAELQETYQDFEEWREDNGLFLAVLGRNRDGSVTYEGRTIPLFKHDSVTIYFPRLSLLYFFNRNSYRHAMLHELGHAFGWRGHSPHSTADVMYNRVKGPTTLTHRDIQHIYQIIAP